MVVPLELIVKGYHPKGTTTLIPMINMLQGFFVVCC